MQIASEMKQNTLDRLNEYKKLDSDFVPAVPLLPAKDNIKAQKNELLELDSYTNKILNAKNRARKNRRRKEIISKFFLFSFLKFMENNFHKEWLKN
jgi:predicted transposase YdaD